MGPDGGLGFHVLGKMSFHVFVVPKKEVLLENTGMLENYEIFKALQWETEAKKVFKSFFCSI